ncbi:MAG TPA: flagellar hook capping FlgD N-terminal domain-containing protein [Bryobacteraceae bacterium]|nr:flagellar hook capping FlgD N-terminal domain-containing protein [Bryobacteraceae bacterium]
MATVTNPLTNPAFSPITGQPATPAVSSAASGQTVDPLANEQTFLKLLVSQLENQDPASPQDPMQFVTQLAQFTQLEQSIGMKQDLDTIQQELAANAQSGAAPATPAP